MVLQSFVLPLSVRAQALTDSPQNSDTVQKGKEYPWPREAPQPLTVAMAWKTLPEERPFEIFRISGDNLVIDMLSISPFVMDEKSMTNPEWPGSVVFSDSYSRSGMLAFSRFAPGVFISKVDTETLAGYARSLMARTDPEKGLKVEIVVPPSELSRKAAMLMNRPLFLTWRMTDENAGTRFQRSDYFFSLEDGSVLVASVVASPEEEPAVRAAAANVLRFGSMESGSGGSK